ncbi:hypothetical protein [Algirhabdus cladophorae]|uniref:hypothetical protein n=1 Tax=Algirhabdus cladophorae TaxID=3377108 RepID=UPI003B848B76
MNLSSNQIVALTIKAARGAGFPLAQAEMFASATAQHLIQSRAVGDLSQALIHTPDSPVLEFPCMLDDLCLRSSLSLSNIRLPDLLRSYAETAAFEVKCIQAGKTLLLKYMSDRPSLASPTARVPMDPVLWAHLNKLAAKTYVPASEESRLSGAGAGLSDND